VHVSTFARNRVAPSLGDHGRHVVIPNPCMVERAPPVDVAANRALVVIGRLTVEKGMRVLASAWRGTGIPLLVLGDGPAREVLTGLDGPVQMLPWGGPDTVLRVLAKARGLVMPSLWDETSGLVAAEALARGVPAIVSRNTGAAELVERTGGGIVVTGGAVAELREAMLRIADAGRAGSLGAAAYDGYWRDPLTLGRHLDDLERLYGELLQASPGRFVGSTASMAASAPS
jgi:glycosyltransferase involved in cell wall biosynthesis